MSFTSRPGHQRPSGWAIPMGISAGAATGLLAGTTLTAMTATPDTRRGPILSVGIALLTAGIVALTLILR